MANLLYGTWEWIEDVTFGLGSNRSLEWFRMSDAGIVRDACTQDCENSWKGAYVPCAVMESEGHPRNHLFTSVVITGVNATRCDVERNE